MPTEQLFVERNAPISNEQPRDYHREGSKEREPGQQPSPIRSIRHYLHTNTVTNRGPLA